MKRSRIKSSNLHTVGYDKESHILEVEFESGSIYQYYAVPLTIYFQLLKAQSAGRFLNQHIANKFQYRNIRITGYTEFYPNSRHLNMPVSKDDIRRIYYKLAHKFHPDRQYGSEKMMRQINQFYSEQNFYALKNIADRFGLI